MTAVQVLFERFVTSLTFPFLLIVVFFSYMIPCYKCISSAEGLVLDCHKTLSVESLTSGQQGNAVSTKRPRSQLLTNTCSQSASLFFKLSLSGHGYLGTSRASRNSLLEAGHGLENSKKIYIYICKSHWLDSSARQHRLKFLLPLEETGEPSGTMPCSMPSSATVHHGSVPALYSHTVRAQ